MSAAASAGRWLLVNVQEPTEFSCTLLNRDVWRHSAMRALLSGPMLLKQLVARSVEGVKYKTLYHARREPHIAVIDPRTRQKMWSWSALPALSSQRVCAHCSRSCISHHQLG